MADLGTIELGTFTNVSTTAITGSDPVLENIAGTNDADFVFDNANNSHTGVARFALGAVPGDFETILTVNIRLRYALSEAADNNVWDSLDAQIFKADATTALTDKVTIVSGPITTTSPTNSSVISLTNPDTGATEAEWNAAVVHISWDISKNKGGDGVQEEVYAAEVTGTYTAEAPPEPTITGVGDDSEPDLKQNVVIAGTNFGDNDTGSAKVEITDNVTYGSGSFEIEIPRDSWSATSIQVDLQQTDTSPLLDILTAGTVFCFVTDSAGARNAVGHAWELKAAGASFIAAKNIGWTQAVDVNFRVRIEIKNTGSSATTPAFKWQYNLASAGWNDITASSAVVQTALSTFFADADDLTEQLLGSDTFVTDNNAAEELTGAFTMGANLPGSQVIETEACLTIVSGDVVDAQTIDLRIVESDGTAFDTYTQTPTITVSEVSGDTTVTVPADALTQVDNDPVINTGVGVEPPADALTQVDNDPVINTGASATVPAEALSQVDNDPVINTGASATVPADALTQVDNDPELRTGVTVIVPADALTQTDNDPVINTGIIVTSPADALTQADNTPTVGTSVLVSAPADALTQADNIPTVGTSVLVSAPADALTQSDNDPALFTGVGVEPPADALTQVDNDPALNTGVTVLSPAEALTQVDNDPIVGTGIIVTVPQDALSQSDNDPAVNTGVAVVVPADALTQADNAPVIGQAATINVPADALTQSDNQPAVETGATVASPQDSLTQVDNDPALFTGVGVEPPADALTQVDNDPEVNTGVTVLSPADALTQVDNDPSAGTGIIVSVPQDALSQVDNDPAVNTGVTISTPADALTQADNVPRIGGGTIIDAPADALTQTDNAPALNTGVTVVTPQDALSQADNTPALNTGARAAVPQDALTIVDNAPGIATGARAGAPADTLAIVDHAPGINTGVTVLPANDNLTISTFAPVITAGPGVPAAAAPSRNPMMVTLGQMMNRRT